MFFLVLYYGFFAAIFAGVVRIVFRYVKNGWRHVLVGNFAGLLIAPCLLDAHGVDVVFPSGYMLTWLLIIRHNPFNDLLLLSSVAITAVLGSIVSLRLNQRVVRRYVKPDRE